MNLVIRRPTQEISMSVTDDIRTITLGQLLPCLFLVVLARSVGGINALQLTAQARQLQPNCNNGWGGV
jgi:hypothetical protein